MKKLQQLLTAVLLVTATVLLTTFTSCSSDDTPSSDGTIVGEWKFVDGQIISENSTDFNGITFDNRIETNYLGDNCIYNFTENPNIVEVTGKLNMEFKVYLNDQLANSSNQVFDYDEENLSEITWELNGNQLTFDGDFFNLNSNQSQSLVENNMAYTITNLTNTNMTWEISGKIVTHDDNLNQDITTNMSGTMNFVRP